MKTKKKEENASSTALLSGFLGADAVVKTDKSTQQKIVSFAVASNNETDKVTWTNVRLTEKEDDHIEVDLKKGDFVELRGLIAVADKGQEKGNAEFVAQEIINHKIKATQKLTQETIVLKGNLGQDPFIKKVMVSEVERTVGLFSIAINDADKLICQNCQVWGAKIESLKIGELRKGDFVKITGHYGKIYTTKSGEKKQDVILIDCNLLKAKNHAEAMK